MKRMTGVAAAAGLLLAAAPALAVDGLVAVESAHDPATTMDRFEEAAENADLNIFVRVNHAEGAASIGEELRPTELIVFGNPQGGTPFMQCAQSVGIDLPLKALTWEDETGQAWLGYNDPAWVAARHGVEDCPVVGGMTEALEGLAHTATAAD